MTTEEHDSAQTGSSSSAVPPPLSVNYLRVMLLDVDRHHVLMQHVHDRWDLPYLVFPWGFNGDVATCCKRFQELLGYHSEELMFSGIIELLGEVGCLRPRGYNSTPNVGFAKLLFVEPREEMPEKELSPGFEWKDLKFVSSIEHDDDYDRTTRYSCRAVISILKGDIPLQRLLPHPPFQPGWFQKASDWLVAEVTRYGFSPMDAPVQFWLSHSSAIVAVDSTDGPFFLKGVAAGSHELQITSAAVKLFPNCTPELISVNKELQSFITRAFDQREIQPANRIEMLRTLAEVQKRSVQHVDDLIGAGVPSLLLQDIEGTLKGWAEDDIFVAAIRARLPDFKEMIPTLLEIINELATYNLPMCLVHGDFACRNVGYRVLEDGKEHMLLHDWQFGALSHPFFEFHDFREDWSGEIDTYLEMWKEYEPLERAREAYELSKLLGWLLKVRGILDCIREGEAPTRFGLSLSEVFLVEWFDIMERKLGTWTKERHAK